VAASLRISQAQAEEIARVYYGVAGKAERLAAEHDDVFRLVTSDGTARLLRAGAAEPTAAAGFQTALLLHLERTAPELPVQRVITALDGRPELVLGEPQPPRLVRMTTYLDGRPLSKAPVTKALRLDIGATLARLDQALRPLRHPGANRTHLWDLQSFPQLRPLLGQLPGTGPRPALLDCFDRFDAVVRPRLARLPKQVIHTDFHGDNLLTDGATGTITGVLDFGDSLAGPVAMDVAVAACYQFGSDVRDPLAPALDVVAGYHAVDPLHDGDLPLIGEFMLLRLAARIIVSQWNAARDPANGAYLLRRTPQAAKHFGLLRAMPAGTIENRLRAALKQE
jgi:Ser/Thr protein kinase RdoA (MazF antagonist)